MLRNPAESLFPAVEVVIVLSISTPKLPFSTETPKPVPLPPTGPL